MGDKRTSVLLFAEGQFEHVEMQPTAAEARAFASGVGTGAGFYGAGSCNAYVMPDDEASMREQEGPEESERALSALGAKGHPLEYTEGDLTREESIAEIDRDLAADGWERIGAVDSAGRRSVWMRTVYESDHGQPADDDGKPLMDDVKHLERIELRAGREGDDFAMTIDRSNPQLDELLSLFCSFRWAVET
jgi:hypothetical protein